MILVFEGSEGNACFFRYGTTQVEKPGIGDYVVNVGGRWEEIDSYLDDYLLHLDPYGFVTMFADEVYVQPDRDDKPSIDADQYQKLAARTLLDKPDGEYKTQELAAVLQVIDLSIAVGALAEYCKKAVFHQHGFDQDKFNELVYATGHVFFDTDHWVRPSPETIVEAQALKLDPLSIMVLWNSLGLIGEAAELTKTANEIAATGGSTAEVQKEAGDLSWYICAILSKFQLSFGSALIVNVEKLKKRYAVKYTSQESKARVDVLGGQ